MNNFAAHRRGEYYWKELSVNNASAAIWQPVTNKAIQSGTTVTVTGNVFTAQSPESLSYDADGNLTNDGRWAYTWDAENRLIRMVAKSTLPAGRTRGAAGKGQCDVQS